MSIKMINLVWDIEGLSPAQKLVLLALADHANDSGNSIRPGVARLISKTSLSERAVRRALADLRSVGWIVVVKNSTNREPNHYRLNVEKINVKEIRGARNAPQDKSGVPEMHPGGARNAPLGVPEMHPNHHKPSKNHQNGGDRPNIFSLYENNIGVLTPMIGEQLIEIEQQYPEGWFEDAVKIACESNARKLSYIKGILKRWATDGKQGKRKGKSKADIKLSNPGATND
jgi:DnaD/phage-associated family protein